MRCMIDINFIAITSNTDDTDNKDRRRSNGSNERRRDRDRDSDRSGDDDEFREGMKVEARFKGRSRWFPATIKFIRRDGTMDLLYDDGGECDGCDWM